MTTTTVTRDPTAPPVRSIKPRGRWRKRILPIYTGVVLFYLCVPIFVMILFGFNDTQGRFNFAWQGFTLQWYRDLFEIPGLTESLKNSLTIAALTTLVSVALGTTLGLATARYRFRGRGGVDLVLFAQIATPEIVLGASLLSLFILTDIPRGYLTILIAHVAFCIPFVAITVQARVMGMDRSLEDAAQDLGATPLVAFRKITLPLIMPGITAGALLSFALSIDDFVITSFNAGQTSTFPLWVYGASRVGVPPQVNVMGTLIFMVGVALALVNAFAARRRAVRA